MDYSKKQKQLDVKKWVDSEINNSDTCGTYNYCANCDKNEAYPCALAYEKFNAIKKLAKETTTTKKAPAKKTTTKATTAKKTTTTTKKTTTTRKTTKVAA